MSNNRGDSILTHDGSLNVDLLSKEIARDAAGEDKYKAEDSMKKRAIYNSKYTPKDFNTIVESMF